MKAWRALAHSWSPLATWSSPELPAARPGLGSGAIGSRGGWRGRRNEARRGAHGSPPLEKGREEEKERNAAGLFDVVPGRRSLFVVSVLAVVLPLATGTTGAKPGVRPSQWPVACWVGFDPARRPAERPPPRHTPSQPGSLSRRGRSPVVALPVSSGVWCCLLLL